MTLIISRASAHFVVQVSDRRVTETTGDLHDPVANKALLLVTPDSAVTMGYTGPAYLEGIPTDEWIGRKLTGETYEGRSLSQAIRMTKDNTLLNDHLDRLQHELNRTIQGSVAGRKWRRYFFNLLIVGWQLVRDGKAEPMLWHLEKPRGDIEFRLILGDKSWNKQKDLRLVATPPGFIDDGEGQQLAADLHDQDLDGTVDKLVAKIEEVSARSALVGPHAMAVKLPPPYLKRAIVDYIPPSEEKTQVVAGDPAPISYSPWVITPGYVIPPSEIIGDISFQAADWRIEHVYHYPVKGGGYVGTQPRSYPPGSPPNS